MKVEIEIPEKYAEKLEEVESVDPTVREQIEIEVLPSVLHLINDAHEQLDDGGGQQIIAEGDQTTGIDDPGE